MAPVSEFSESAMSFNLSRKSVMKIAVILVVGSLMSATCSSTNKATLSRTAAIQLQRLAPFWRSTLDKDTSRKSDEYVDQQLQIPIDFNELLRIFNNTKSHDKRIDSTKLNPEKIDALNRYAEKLMQDKRVQLYVKERIKRNGYSEEYGTGGSGGSGSFVSGLAGQLVGSVIGLSSTGSKGSSSFSGHKSLPVYGPPIYQSYGKDSFNIWDFKRAILNTLIQAVKAISGGVLALKGQIIKGSGFLISTKGRIISTAGETISGLGKSLASSAIVQPPPQYSTYGSGGYVYETPQIVAHNEHYDGLPPTADGYHSSLGAASNTIYAYAYYPPNVHYHHRKSKPMG